MGESNKKTGKNEFYAEDFQFSILTIWIFNSKILKTAAVSFSVKITG